MLTEAGGRESSICGVVGSVSVEKAGVRDVKRQCAACVVPAMFWKVIFTVIKLDISKLR